MFLAFRELRRSKTRFGLLVAAVALLGFLILFQQAIRDSLLTSFVGGIRNASADVVVFDVDGRRFLQSSTISPDLELAVRAVEGVAAVGRIGQGTFPIEVDGDVELVAVVGSDLDGIWSPVDLVEGRQPAAPGEVIANAADADRGFAIGDRVTVTSGLELTVVGRADDVGLNVTPTVYASWDTYLEVARSRNPELMSLAPNALGVRAAAGVDPGELAERINEASVDLDALTAGDAADENPGVVSIRQSFGVIFALFAAVVPLVIGLFFLIVTTQKTASLTLLRAVGAPAGRLARAVLVQVGVVLGAGLAAATAAYALLSSQRLDGLAIEFDGRAVAFWAGVLGVLGILSALGSIRRVLAVDPVRAVDGGGLR